MVDVKEIDSLFNETSQHTAHKTEETFISKHSRRVHLAKLLLPSFAAVLTALLLIFPSLKQDEKSFLFDITLPKKGELEKLHIEKTVLNITDKNNRVNNFTADNIDETEPGSKLIKLQNPDGMMPTSESEWINIKSPTGFYDQKDNTLQLVDNVEIYYSQGMNIYVPDIFYDFKTSIAHSNNKVQAQGEMGDLTSEGFIMDTDKGTLTFIGKTFIKIREAGLKE